jgi:hypothetical protein
MFGSESSSEDEWTATEYSKSSILKESVKDSVKDFGSKISENSTVKRS